MLGLLSALVDKSLVVAETLQAGEARYRLLETIRQYAREKLAASADWTPAHDHYLACYLRLSEEVAPKLRQQQQQLWFNWLETENDNIRAALAWALESERIESGLRIAVALFQFWTVRGNWQEGLAWFERLLAQAAVEAALHLRLPALGAAQGGMGAAQALTAREREVVILIAQGQSNAEIADALVLSKRTVEKHIANILSELGLTSRAQVVRWAIAHGLLDAAS